MHMTFSSSYAKRRTSPHQFLITLWLLRVLNSSFIRVNMDMNTFIRQKFILNKRLHSYLQAGNTPIHIR
jgi:hypothetical protein